MKNLEKLIELNEKFSKENELGGVLTINISGIISSEPDLDAISQEDMKCIEECQKKGMMCEIYFFNLTPVGHYRVFDSSVEGAALKMLNIFEEIGK